MREQEQGLITSRDNPHVKRWHQLLESRGIRKAGQFLVFGETVVKETLRDHPEKCAELIYPSSWNSTLYPQGMVSPYHLDEKLFQTLDVFGTKAPVLVCQVPPIGQWEKGEAPQGLEIICPVGDPSNMGAILRSCQAFGVQKVILLKEAASPFHPKSVRSASGAILNVSFVQGPSIKDLSKNEFTSTLVALDISGANIVKFQWPKNIRMLIGEEGQGLPEDSIIPKISISMKDGMHSLNAAIATSIAMYSYHLRHSLNK